MVAIKGHEGRSFALCSSPPPLLPTVSGKSIPSLALEPAFTCGWQGSQTEHSCHLPLLPDCWHCSLLLCDICVTHAPATISSQGTVPWDCEGRKTLASFSVSGIWSHTEKSNQCAFEFGNFETALPAWYLELRLNQPQSVLISVSNTEW